MSEYRTEPLSLASQARLDDLKEQLILLKSARNTMHTKLLECKEEKFINPRGKQYLDLEKKIEQLVNNIYYLESGTDPYLKPAPKPQAEATTNPTSNNLLSNYPAPFQPDSCDLAYAKYNALLAQAPPSLVPNIKQSNDKWVSSYVYDLGLDPVKDLEEITWFSIIQTRQFLHQINARLASAPVEGSPQELEPETK